MTPPMARLAVGSMREGSVYEFTADGIGVIGTVTIDVGVTVNIV